MVRIKANGLPPVGYGRKRFRRRERREEVSNGGLMGWVPVAIPYNVEVNGRSKDRTHVVLKVNQVGRAFIVLGLLELLVLAI